MNQKGSSLIYVLVVLLLIIGALGYYFLTQNNQTYSGSINLQSPTPVVMKCNSNGIDNNKDDIYTKYIVKQGDTLLSIAKTQLKDTSRIGDIIYINRDAYPQLSIQTPFIEIGWILYLPPTYIQHIDTIGQGEPELPYKASGPLVSNSPDGKWVINLDTLNSKYSISPDSNTQFTEKAQSDYKVGDCLTAVIQGIGMKVYKISPQ